MTKILFYAAVESWISLPDQSSKLNRTGTIVEVFIPNFILYPMDGSENIWTEPDQWQTNRLIAIYPFIWVSHILKPTWSSEECPQERFWNFGHNFDLLSKKYFLDCYRFWSLIYEALVALNKLNFTIPSSFMYFLSRTGSWKFWQKW